MHFLGNLAGRVLMRVMIVTTAIPTVERAVVLTIPVIRMVEKVALSPRAAVKVEVLTVAKAAQNQT